MRTQSIAICRERMIRKARSVRFVGMPLASGGAFGAGRQAISKS